MQLNRGRIAAHDDRIKVKAVSEAADDRELIAVRRRLSAGGRRTGFGVGVGRNNPASFVWIREAMYGAVSAAPVARSVGPGGMLRSS